MNRISPEHIARGLETYDEYRSLGVSERSAAILAGLKISREARVRTAYAQHALNEALAARRSRPVGAGLV